MAERIRSTRPRLTRALRERSASHLALGSHRRGFDATLLLVLLVLRLSGQPLTGGESPETRGDLRSPFATAPHGTAVRRVLAVLLLPFSRLNALMAFEEAQERVAF